MNNSRPSTKLDKDFLVLENTFLSDKTKSQPVTPISLGKTTRVSTFKSIQATNDKAMTLKAATNALLFVTRREFAPPKIVKPGNGKLLLKKFKASVHASGFCAYYFKKANTKFKQNLNKYISFALIMNQTNENAYKISDQTLIKTEMMNFKHAFKEQIENSEYNIDDSIKEILRKPHRSIKEVQLLKKAFKHWFQLKSINQLTDVMQNKYYQNCRLEEFEQNRVISLQESTPDYFYILIKGSLVCTYKKRDETQSHTICFIEKGCTYGDLPLFSNSNHTSTLIARTNVQLLVIDNEVFIDIFVNQNQNNKLNKQYLLDLLNKKAKQHYYLNESVSKVTLVDDTKTNSIDDEKLKNKQISLDDIRYLREMTFLKAWPIDLFMEEPNSVRSCVFNREQLITPDSNSSKFIYVIKSGTISVLVTINKNNIDSIEDNDVPQHDTDNKKNLNEAGYFPQNILLDDHHKDVLFHEGMLKKRTEEEIKKDIESKMRLNEVMTYLASMKKLDAETNRDASPSKDKSDEQDEQSQHHHSHHAANGVADVKHLIHMDSDDAASLSELDDEDEKTNKLDAASWLDFAIKKITQTNRKNKESILDPAIQKFKSKLKKFNKDPAKAEKKVKFSDRVDVKKGSLDTARRVSRIEPLEPLGTLVNKSEGSSKGENQYLFVHKLYPGDHFGLADLLFDKQPSLQLVSNGCECILISKEFFVQNSNLEYLKRLKNQEAPYPRLEQIEHNYKLYLTWRNYSSSVIKNTLHYKQN